MLKTTIRAHLVAKCSVRPRDLPPSCKGRTGFNAYDRRGEPYAPRVVEALLDIPAGDFRVHRNGAVSIPVKLLA